MTDVKIGFLVAISTSPEIESRLNHKVASHKSPFFSLYIKLFNEVFMMPKLPIES